MTEGKLNKAAIITTLVGLCSLIFVPKIHANSTTYLGSNMAGAEPTSSSHSAQIPAVSSNRDLPPCAHKESYLLQGTQPTWLSEGLEYLDRFQVWMGGYVQSTSEGIDAYFGTDEAFEVSSGSRVDILTPMVFHSSGESELGVRIRAKFDLPKIRRNWQLFLETEDTSLKGQTDSSPATDAQEQSTGLVGLRYMVDELDKKSLTIDVGAQLEEGAKLDPYIRLKKRYEWRPAEHWPARMSHALFYESLAGWGLDSKWVFDHRLNTDYLFRAQTELLAWYDLAYLDITQRALLYQQVNPHRLYTYQLFSQWDTQEEHSEFEHWRQVAYGLNMNWREQVYKNWLFVELQPGVQWQEDDNFTQPDYTVMLQLEMRFFGKRP